MALQTGILACHLSLWGLTMMIGASTDMCVPLASTSQSTLLCAEQRYLTAFRASGVMQCLFSIASGAVSCVQHRTDASELVYIWLGQTKDRLALLNKPQGCRYLGAWPHPI